MRLPVGTLVRTCGPEPGMAYPVDPIGWARRIERLATGIGAIETLPPVIVEWCAGRLMVRDGNHRVAALAARSESVVFAVVWCNAPDDLAAARRHPAIVAGLDGEPP